MIPPGASGSVRSGVENPRVHGALYLLSLLAPSERKDDADDEREDGSGPVIGTNQDDTDKETRAGGIQKEVLMNCMQLKV